MKRSLTYKSSSDHKDIYAQVWQDELRAQPKAIVQIAHGMAEHIDRYDAFAISLVSDGIFVFGNDHRGHGRTAKHKEELGYFADKNGFEKVTEDMYTLTKLIHEEYPSTPVFLFGHSMGSFLARRYIQLHGEELSGVILSGTGGNPGFTGKVGQWIALTEMKLKGRKAPSPLLTQLSFGSFNNAFKPTRTSFDWLTSDAKVVDQYIQDALCGNVSTAGFFYDLFEGLTLIHSPANNANIPKELPIFLFSGEKDPVGNQTKGVLETYQSYVDIGIQDVSYKFYEEGRHEMLNEVNKEEVFSDVLKWINEKLKNTDVST